MPTFNPFRKRAVPEPVEGPQAQWAAIKAAARDAADWRRLESLAQAEDNARECLADQFGRTALFYPTAEQTELLCSLALQQVSASAISLGVAYRRANTAPRFCYHSRRGVRS